MFLFFYLERLCSFAVDAKEHKQYSADDGDHITLTCEVPGIKDGHTTPDPQNIVPLTKQSVETNIRMDIVNHPGFSIASIPRFVDCCSIPQGQDRHPRRSSPPVLRVCRSTRLYL